MTESTDQKLDSLLGELRRRNRLTTVSISPEEHNAILVALKRIPKLERDLRSQDDFIQQLHEDCGELIKRAERVEKAAQKLAQCAQEAVDADNPFIRHQLTALDVALQQYRIASTAQGKCPDCGAVIKPDQGVCDDCNAAPPSNVCECGHDGGEHYVNDDFVCARCECTEFHTPPSMSAEEGSND